MPTKTGKTKPAVKNPKPGITNDGVERVRKDKRRKQNVVKRGQRLPAHLKDPEFMSEADLNLREVFAQAYVAHGKLAKAAEIAGYKGNTRTLTTAGYRLINEPAVKARIDEIRDNVLQDLRITQKDVLGELVRIGFADIGEITDEQGDLLPLKQIPKDTRRAISSYKVKRTVFGEDGESIEKEVKFESKKAALDKLGQHAGLWNKENDKPGVSAEDFLRALMEGVARASQRRTIEHQP